MDGSLAWCEACKNETSDARCPLAMALCLSNSVSKNTLYSSQPTTVDLVLTNPVHTLGLIGICVNKPW